MATSQDTEITLGTGKLLLLFFALVGLCAVFFGFGFATGKNSARIVGDTPSPMAAGTIVHTDATKPSANPPAPAANLGFYKDVEQKDADAKLTPPEEAKADTKSPDTASASTTAAAANPSSVPSPTTPPVLNGYYVQVAAVSKQEDAQALVDALKQKQYTAFSANSSLDKLFHVQIGPFADAKDAEVLRAKLISDGYNPILKK